MAYKQIVSYVVAWHPGSKVGQVKLFYKDGTNSSTDVPDGNSFIAIHSILSSSQNTFLLDDGRLVTGTEPVDGD